MTLRSRTPEELKQEQLESLQRSAEMHRRASKDTVNQSAEARRMHRESAEAFEEEIRNF